MKQYHIFKDNQRIGPVDVEQLSQLGLTPNSMVWTEGMSQWLPASQVSELASYMVASSQPQSTPIPPPPPLNQPQQSYQLPLDFEPLSKSQKIARGILFFPVVLALLIGILMTIMGLVGTGDIKSSAVYDQGQY